MFPASLTCCQRQECLPWQHLSVWITYNTYIIHSSNLLHEYQLKSEQWEPCQEYSLIPWTYYSTCRNLASQGIEDWALRGSERSFSLKTWHMIFCVFYGGGDKGGGAVKGCLLERHWLQRWCGGLSTDSKDILSASSGTTNCVTYRPTCAVMLEVNQLQIF